MQNLDEKVISQVREIKEDLNLARNRVSYKVNGQHRINQDDLIKLIPEVNRKREDGTEADEIKLW